MFAESFFFHVTKLSSGLHVDGIFGGPLLFSTKRAPFVRQRPEQFVATGIVRERDSPDQLYAVRMQAEGTARVDIDPSAKGISIKQ